MRYGTPINQRPYQTRYNPLHGRRVLSDQIGFFKETARVLGLGGITGIDPKEEAGLFVNKPMVGKFDANTAISEFLDKYLNTDSKHIRIISDNEKKYLKIGNSYDKHSFQKRGSYYYLKTKSKILNNKNSLPLKIAAKDDAELVKKLGWILNNPLSRAKLELKIQKFPLLNSENIAPGHGRYILFSENKIIPNSYIQPFHTPDSLIKANEFNSAMGDVSASQMNYFTSHYNKSAYSDKSGEPDFTTIHDDFWIRIHAITEHLLSSNVTDELLGNIANMYSTRNTLNEEQKGHLVQKMREDYIYNVHGKGTRSSRQRDESPAAISYEPRKSGVFKHLDLAANTLRGGRFWKSFPPSLEQTILSFYSPTGDGKRICKYDIDPEKFMKFIRRLKVTATDRQYIAAYGRKTLASYVVLKLLGDEISQIKPFDKKKSKQEQLKAYQKWVDLNKVQDEIFEATGDMRDFLRRHNSGFGQVLDCVSVEDPRKIPEFKPQAKTDEKKLSETLDDEKRFIDENVKNHLYYIQNYTRFEDCFGWHAREKTGSMMAMALINKSFDRPISKMIAGATGTIFMEGIENLSRELKYIETTLGRDTNFKGMFHNFIERWTLGDKHAIGNIGEWDKNRIIRGLNQESHYPSGKRQTLQAEGIMMENDYFPPNTRTYIGENQGWLFGNTPVGRIITAFANKWIGHILNNFHMYSLHFKAIKKEMEQKKISDPYQTKAMHRLEDYMRKTADVLTDKYMNDKHENYKVLTKPQLEKVRFEIKKKMYNFLQFTANTSALLANGKDICYK